MQNKKKALPALPKLLEQKLVKTGYTRGASVREIYQNRVTRNNTVLIPWDFWGRCKDPDGTGTYENGFIVLVEPSWYRDTPSADKVLAAEGIELGVNALLLFRHRSDWNQYLDEAVQLPKGKKFVAATSRSNPLGGTCLARIHATVADTGSEIVEGFNAKKLRGAGIRVYEYASSGLIAQARLQLEALVWMCNDADDAMVAAGMPKGDASIRKKTQIASAEQQGLLDRDRLRDLRIIDYNDQTVCPLCQEPISAADFLKRGDQAEGRETYDLTITEVNLFHIQELRVGTFQHRPYNLGWGHHFCNVVVKDVGIESTLEWMRGVLRNQSGPAQSEEEAESVEEAIEG